MHESPCLVKCLETPRKHPRLPQSLETQREFPCLSQRLETQCEFLRLFALKMMALTAGNSRR